MKNIFIALLFLVFVTPARTHASEPCYRTVKDCPAGPINGLVWNAKESRDDSHLYHDEGAHKIECHYGTSKASSIEISYFCMKDENTAKLESQYNNHEKKRPPSDNKLIQRKNDYHWKRYRGPCEIASPTNADAQRCKGFTYAGRYLVSVLGTYPWNRSASDRKAAIAVSDAGAMRYVEAGKARALGPVPEETEETEYGVVVKNGRLYITSRPGETLNVKTQDLPQWAVPEIVTVGTSVATVCSPTKIVTGDPNISFNGLPIARVGDTTSHGGEISVGSDRIFINGRAAAKVGSFVASPHVVGTVPCVGGRILRH